MIIALLAPKATLLALHNQVTVVYVIPKKVEKINNRISFIQDDAIIGSAC